LSRADLEEDQESRDSSRSLDKKEKLLQNPPETDRQARYSLYDFPSDSEAEEKSSKSNGTEKKSNPVSQDNGALTPSESDSKKTQITSSRESSPLPHQKTADSTLILSEIKGSTALASALNTAGDSQKL